MGLGGVCLIFGEDIKYLTDPNNLIGVLALLGAVIFWSTVHFIRNTSNSMCIP